MFRSSRAGLAGSLLIRVSGFFGGGGVGGGVIRLSGGRRGARKKERETKA